MSEKKFRTIAEATLLSPPNSRVEEVEEGRQHMEFVKHANAGRLSKVRRIYMAADVLTAAVSAVAVCQKGCNSCCHIDVGLTELEAQFIERNAGKKMKTGTTRSSGHGGTKTPCPFLSGGSCSIYEVRPFVCRTHFALDDPRFCAEIDTKHITYDARGNPVLSELARMLVNLDGHHHLRDIRDFFS